MEVVDEGVSGRGRGGLADNRDGRDGVRRDGVRGDGVRRDSGNDRRHGGEMILEPRHQQSPADQVVEALFITR